MSKLINREWKKFIILIIGAIIIAVAIEYFAFNGSKISLPKEQQGTTLLDLSDVTSKGFENQENELLSSEEESIIKFDFENKYIDKLLITYTAKENFSTKIINTQVGLYGIKTSNTYEREHSNKINIICSNIDAKSNEVEITIKGKDVTIQSIQIDNRITMNNYRLLFLSGSFIVLGALFIFREKFSVNYEKSFIVIALVAGFFYIFFTPNATTISQDDEIHFLRSYEVINFSGSSYTASSDQMTRTVAFPSSAIRSKEELEQQTKYLRTNDNTVIRETYGKKYIEYNQLCYIPSGLGINIAKLFNAPFDIMFKMGKITNLIVYAVVMYMAIKMIPIKKYLLLFFALLPTNISLASSYSYDSIITSFLMLGIALFLKEYYSENKISPKWVATYAVVMTFGVLPKAVYAPFILLPLVFKKEKFNDKKTMIHFKVWLVLLCLIVASSFILPTLLSPSVIGDTRAAGTSVSGQMKLIFSNIFDFIVVFYNNAGKQFFDKILGMSTIGQLGYLGVVSSNVHYLSVIMLISLATIKNNDERVKLPVSFKWLIGTIIFITVGFIWTALYLSFNSVGVLQIQGVQGRYFLPLLLPLLLCIDIRSIKSKISAVTLNTFVSIISCGILLSTIYQLVLKAFCF